MRLTLFSNDALWHCLCPVASIAQSGRPCAYKLSSLRAKIHTIKRTSCRPFSQQSSIYSRRTRLSSNPVLGCQTKQWLLQSSRTLSTIDNAASPSTQDIRGGYEDLKLFSKRADYIRVQAQVEQLVRVKHETPNLRLYEALILANGNPQLGSAAEVARLLQEMEDGGIMPDSATYHAILRALAVHPDYLLRSHVLQCLSERWFSLTRHGHHDVVVGLLKDRQLELALQHFDRMKAESVEIYPWLYDMIIYNLCNVNEFDEALKLMHERLDSGHPDLSGSSPTLHSSTDSNLHQISGTLWFHLLDTASRNHHHEATVLAYNARVATGYLNPPSGICCNILNCAARHGDTGLATAVFDLLAQRSGNPIQLHHYETLIETYANAADLSPAFALLSTMAAAGHPPTSASTRPILLNIKNLEPRNVVKAHDILEKMRDEGRPVALEALHVLLEGYVHHSNLPGALHLYNTMEMYTAPRPQHPRSSSSSSLPSTSSSNSVEPANSSFPPTHSPTTATYNLLLRACEHQRDKSHAMFFASEMVSLKVMPDALTYDRLILVCIKCDTDLNDAWQYLAEMRGHGYMMRAGTAIYLARRACELRDRRLWELDRGRGGQISGQKLRALMQEAGWGEDEQSGGGSQERHSQLNSCSHGRDRVPSDSWRISIDS